MDDELRQRILDLEAKDEIRALCAAYCRGLDRLDKDLIRSVYFDDAVESRGFFEGGPDGFVEFAINVLKQHDANQHMLGQIAIELDGNRAYGEAYFQAFHRFKENGIDRDFWVGGRYIDRYERRDGVWKIAYRSEINDWISNRPAAEDFYWIRNPTALKGARGTTDRINQPEHYKGS